MFLENLFLRITLKGYFHSKVTITMQKEVHDKKLSILKLFCAIIFLETDKIQNFTGSCLFVLGIYLRYNKREALNNFLLSLIFPTEFCTTITLSDCTTFDRQASVLKNFAILTGKHMCWSLFFTKVAGNKSAIVSKKKFRHKYFPLNFVKFLRTSISQNICERLL